MNQRRILRTDLIVQCIFLTLFGIALLLWLALGLVSYLVGTSAFLLLLSWQFFSGIYIAAELKWWYRGAIPMALLMAMVMSILLIALGMRTGVLLAFGLAPVIAIANFIVSIMDFQKSNRNITLINKNIEKILDSEEIFNT